MVGLVLASQWAPVAVCAEDELGTVVALQRHQQALFECTAPSVVFISARGHFGSGFFVNREGLILTNAHVVGAHKQVEVVLHDGSTYAGDVVALAPGKLDLALIQIPVNNTPRLSLDVTDLRVGAWVAAIGHGKGGAWTFTTGMVSNIYTEKSRSVFQTQIPLNPGASGGPILDAYGRVMGVVTAGIKGANSINFAIRADDVRRAFPLLASPEASSSGLRIRVPAGVAVFLDGNHVGVGPEVVVPLAAGEHEVMVVIEGTLVRRKVVWPRSHTLSIP